MSMTKAFLLGMMAGVCKGMRESDNPYNYYNDHEEEAHGEWAEGFKEACHYWQESMLDISELGKKE